MTHCVCKDKSIFVLFDDNPLFDILHFFFYKFKKKKDLKQNCIFELQFRLFYVFLLLFMRYII